MELVQKLRNPALDALEAAFRRDGYSLWFVGGCVRDTLDGREPKDVDLATDATPDEQVAVYEKVGIHYIPTGLQHGTITARVFGESYEITTLRTESNHDGRWADMTYTRDLEDDLARRDLTINAMALTFDGRLIDPFGGMPDLAERRVRFVGCADDRMREDYLRILRWFRFHGRFAAGTRLDDETCEAVKRQAGGLRQISRERVWSEMSKIIAGPYADTMLHTMHTHGVGEAIDLPLGRNVIARARTHTDDPVSLIARYVGDTATVGDLAQKWKWSSRERAQGRLVSDRMMSDTSLAALKVRAAVHGEPVAWLAEAARVNEDSETAKKLLAWPVAEFPVTGDDMIAMGYQPGRLLGEVLWTLKCEWGYSGFRIGRSALLKRAENALRSA